MAMLTNPSKAFPIALTYITAGTLIDIWAILALIYYPPASSLGHFLVVGLIVTGFALFVIGILLGHIGRAARHAELPPTEVTSAVANTDATAAANPPPIVSAPPGTAVVPNNGTPPAAKVAASIPPPAVPVQVK